MILSSSCINILSPTSTGENLIFVFSPIISKLYHPLTNRENLNIWDFPELHHISINIIKWGNLNICDFPETMSIWDFIKFGQHPVDLLSHDFKSSIFGLLLCITFYSEVLKNKNPSQLWNHKRRGLSLRNLKEK